MVELLGLILIFRERERERERDKKSQLKNAYNLQPRYE